MPFKVYTAELDVDALKALGDAYVEKVDFISDDEINTLGLTDAKKRLDALVKRGYAQNSPFMSSEDYALTDKGLTEYTRRFMPDFSTEKVVAALREQTKENETVDILKFIEATGMPEPIVMQSLWSLHHEGAVCLLNGLIFVTPRLADWIS